MADSATYTTSWLHAVEAFNKGDLATFGEVIADDCVFRGIGNNKAEILKTIQRNREEGWQTHNPDRRRHGRRLPGKRLRKPLR